jgi:hypothetical protein
VRHDPDVAGALEADFAGGHRGFSGFWRELWALTVG